VQSSRAEDLQDINKALHASSLELTDASNRELRRQSSRWFGARWASSLVNQVVSHNKYSTETPYKAVIKSKLSLAPTFGEQGKAFASLQGSTEVPIEGES